MRNPPKLTGPSKTQPLVVAEHATGHQRGRQTMLCPSWWQAAGLRSPETGQPITNRAWERADRKPAGSEHCPEK